MYAVSEISRSGGWGRGFHLVDGHIKHKAGVLRRQVREWC